MSQAWINSTLIGIIIIVLTIAIMLFTRRQNWITKFIMRYLPLAKDEALERKYMRISKHFDVCVEAEQRYLAELDLYKTVERIASVGGFIWDMRPDPDKVTYTNQFARMFGLHPGQIVTSKAILDVIHVDDIDRVKLAIRHSFETGTNLNIEYRIVMQNFSIVHVHSCSEPVPNTLKETVQMRGFVRIVNES